MAKRHFIATVIFLPLFFLMITFAGCASPGGGGGGTDNTDNIDKAWSQDAYLKTSNNGTGDFFGKSVAISGDVIVVGAYHEDSAASSIDNDDGSASGDDSSADSGAAYVFKKDAAGNWIQDAYLKALNRDIDDIFGFSVAISGDVIVVGAHNEDSAIRGVYNDDIWCPTDNNASNSGAAYVFKKDASGDWIHDAKLKASNGDENDFFGQSVAISGDVIVVGVVGEDSSEININNSDNSPSDPNNGSTDSGAAYVFKKDATGDWIQDAYLKASNSDTGDYFGQSVAISGDVIVIGALWEDSNATSIDNTDGSASDNDSGSSGAAYVFKKDATGDWIQDAYLKASNNDLGDSFGQSVAINGDVIVVGSYGEESSVTSIDNADGSASDDNSIDESGAVYVFKKDAAGLWSQDAYLKASNNKAYIDFGYSVAISGDVIIVGASGEDSSATSTDNTDSSASDDDSGNANGAVYVFKKDAAGDWVQDAYLKESNNSSVDNFGTSVSISGDVIVVGAFQEDSNAASIENRDGLASANDSSANSGAAYIFKR